MKIMRAYKYRLYPTAEQEARLSAWVAAVRTVYNAALNQRKWYGRPVGTDPHNRDCRFNAFRQTKEIHLRELKHDDELEWIADAPANAFIIALRDLEKAFQNFFRGRARYPSFRRYGLNDSFTLPVFTVGKSQRKGWLMNVVFGKDCVRLPKIGRVRYRKHKKHLGKAKTVTVSRAAGQWHISVACEIEIADPAENTRPTVGIDIGVTKPLMLSTGDHVERDQGLVKLDKRKRRLQRELARCKRGSERRQRRKAKMSKVARKIAARRNARIHRITTQITRAFGKIAIEDLKVANMTASAKGDAENPGKKVKQKAGLNREVLNVAPFEVRRQLTYKAEAKGAELVAVPPAYTSQTCSKCGAVDAESRKGARFVCTSCTAEINADLNAAINIERKAFDTAAVAGRRNAPSESHSPGGNEGQGPATQNPIVSSLAGRDHSEFLASELLFHPINQPDTQHQVREPSI